MRKKIIVFAGPTISHSEVKNNLEALCLPPAKAGDIVKVLKKYSPDIIAIIDGVYEKVPAVWHKEILYAMSQGVEIYGSSSMGALRASELNSFGMKGVGKVFDLFNEGHLEDDDEVAVLHGEEDTGFLKFSEAMINFRLTIDLAIRREIITLDEADNILNKLKSYFYKQRSFSTLKTIIEELNLNPKKEIHNFIVKNFIDQKKDDAFLMLQIIKNDFSKTDHLSIDYSFFETVFFKQLVNEVTAG